MAIQSAGEFEIIVNTLLMRLMQRLDAEPQNRGLITARKIMESGVQWAIQRKKPSEKELKDFADAAENIRQSFRNDTALSDQLFDLLDFLEYRL
jgi:hypothetical protein